MKASPIWAGALFSSALLFSGELSPKFEKWLNQDVVYIISAEERTQFLKLSTDSEREAFVDRFWKIRDTDPSTEENEFRHEHYERIQYANEHFAEGTPGWKTERGRIWIMHGPPDDIHYEYGGQSLNIEIANPTGVLAGDSYSDKQRQYRLSFSAPETEIWIYRHIPGAHSVSSHFEVIFSRTDPVQIYQLTQALRFAAGTAQNLSERSRRDYAIMTFMRGHYFGGPYKIVYAGEYRFQDLDDFFQSVFHPIRLPRIDESEYRMALQDLERSPGERLMEKLAMGRALRERVRSRVFFEDLPVQVRVGTMQSQSGSTVLPICIGIPELDSKGRLLHQEDDTLDLMLELVNGQGDTAASLVDSVRLNRKDDAQGRTGRFLYQTRLAARPGTYHLSVYAALRTRSSSALRELEIEMPDYASGGLQMSDLLLFEDVLTKDAYKHAAERGDGDLPRFLGRTSPVFIKDHVLIPTADSRFRRGQKLTAFFEVYNPGISSATKAPALQVRCKFVRDDGQLEELPERLLSYLSDSDSHKATYGISIPLISFVAGRYSLQFDVYDPIQGEAVSRTAAFTVY